MRWAIAGDQNGLQNKNDSRREAKSEGSNINAEIVAAETAVLSVTKVEVDSFTSTTQSNLAGQT